MMDLGSVVVDVGLVVVLDYWGGDNLDLVVVVVLIRVYWWWI